MNSNKAIELGVASFNAAAEENAAAKVSAAIRNIKNEQASIGVYQETIKCNQESLRKIATNGFTPASVFGGPIPEGPNKATMEKAIETMNAGQQERVAASTKSYTQSINDAQTAIAACEARIAKIRTEAAGIVPATTTVSEVMGS